MATKAKAASSSSSCLSFLKDALLLPTRNAKLFIPVFLLLAVPSFLLQTTNLFCIQPLAAGILARADEIKDMDPSSPDYARLAAEILRQARELAAVAVAVMVFAMACGFANQVVAFFAASTTYSGDRYSLPELFSEVIAKWRRLRGPLVTVAMAGALNATCMLLLAELLHLAMRYSGAALAAAAVVALPFVAFLYLNVVFLVAVAVSAADAERRGAGALRLAWRLMTRVWRKQGCALAVAVHAVAMAPSPLYAVALGYARKSVPAGMALIAAYALVSGLVELFYFAAATAFYYQAMESKEVMALDDDYVKVPTGEATV